MKAPGPDHPVIIEKNPRRVRVEIKGHIIADTVGALSLHEARYPAVQYIPREDVKMGFFGMTGRHTTCPYKGEASYFTARIDGEVLENVAWTYESPYPAVEAIRGMLAFYPDRARVYEVDAEV